MALGVLVLVVIDMILLIPYTSIRNRLGYDDVVLVPNRDRPRSVSGVSLYMSSIVNACISSCRSIHKEEGEA